jgi:N-acetylglucosaminyldiphosphoundecaprenol N-acetyl-beta-D-mannosaminyltransferase
MTTLGSFTIYTGNRESLKKRFLEIIAGRKPSQAVTLNSLMFNASLENPALSRTISKACLVIPDSIGISIASTILSLKYVRRMPGIDLIDDLCDMALQNNLRLFLLGSKQDVIETAAKNLASRFHGLNICGTHHGYFSAEQEDSIISSIRDKNPDILLVGLEVPRQETWIFENLDKLGVPLVMGVGGSFDVVSGRLKRAPVWMRVFGLEWFFRFVQQPWRIFRIMNLPFFILNVVKMSCLRRKGPGI